MSQGEHHHDNDSFAFEKRFLENCNIKQSDDTQREPSSPATEHNRLGFPSLGQDAYDPFQDWSESDEQRPIPVMDQSSQDFAPSLGRDTFNQVPLGLDSETSKDALFQYLNKIYVSGSIQEILSGREGVQDAYISAKKEIWFWATSDDSPFPDPHESDAICQRKRRKTTNADATEAQKLEQIKMRNRESAAESRKRSNQKKAKSDIENINLKRQQDKLLKLAAFLVGKLIQNDDSDILSHLR